MSDNQEKELWESQSQEKIALVLQDCVRKLREFARNRIAGLIDDSSFDLILTDNF